MKQWMLYLCLMLSALCMVGCANLTTRKDGEVRVNSNKPLSNVEIRDADGNVLLTKEHISGAWANNGDNSRWDYTYVQVAFTDEGYRIMEKSYVRRKGTQTSLYINNELMATRIEGDDTNGVWTFDARNFLIYTENYEEALQLLNKIYDEE